MYLGLILWLMVYSIPFADLNLRFDQFISDSYNLFNQAIGLTSFLSYFVAVQYAISMFYIGVGCIIFIRKPSDRIALLTSLGLIAIPYMVYFSDLFYELNPSGTMGKLLLLAEGAAGSVSILAIPLLLLLFPDGKITPVWVSRSIRFFFIPLILSIGLFGFGETQMSTPVGPVLLGELAWVLLVLGAFPMAILGVFSQMYKYSRISSSLQRQQTKWVFFSLMTAVIWLLLPLSQFTSSLDYRMRGIFALFVVVMNLLVFGFVPLAFAISIFRYRLYDIDLLIRRTLQYGLLTGLLLGFYYLVIVVLQAGLAALTGQADSPVVIVVSTLSIAALFNPLRRRIQAFIDRRFFRSRYDAERVMADFSASIRSEVDLDMLGVSMLSIVNKTMQPEQASLWLIPEKPGRRGSE